LDFWFAIPALRCVAWLKSLNLPLRRVALLQRVGEGLLDLVPCFNLRFDYIFVGLFGTYNNGERESKHGVQDQQDDEWACFHVVQADSDAEIKEAVADKGYHKNETLGKCRAEELRTYICEPDGPHRRWTDKPAEYESACRANRRRLKGDRNKRLQKLRCERVERSFAHVCETGGARRTWMRGLENNRKNVRLKVAAHNLGLILRKLLGSSKPRELAGLCGQLLSLFLTLQIATSQLYRSIIARYSLNRLHRCCNHFPLNVTTAVI
jgi:hypothetical protein